MGRDFDAVIVGSGIVGCAVALELSRLGFRTLNVDKGPAAGYGSTSSSCAIVRTHYSTLDGTLLAYESWFCWKDWEAHLGGADEGGPARLRETGCLMVVSEADADAKGVLAHARVAGIPFEEWDADEVERRMPLFDARSFHPARRLDDPRFGEPSGPRIAGGVFFPRAGYVNDPQRAARDLQQAAQRAGAVFLFGREAVGVPRTGGRVAGVVLAGGERVDAPVVVNAAGPHSSLLNRAAGADEGMRIGTRALRREVAHVPSPAGFDFEARGFVTTDNDVGGYLRPETGNHLLVGSLDPPCDEREWVHPDRFARTLTGQARTQVCRMGQRIPALGVPSRLRGVADCYDVSDDWIPVYDRSGIDGYYMAVGTSGNQFKTAPLVGALMARLIVACEKGHDHDGDPVSLALPRTGRTVSLGFYSRLRAANPSSSMTVMG